MVGEETADDTDLEHDEEAESQADQAGGDAEAIIQARKALFGVGERRAHGAGDEHHPGDRADAKEEEVGNGPFRIANRGEDEERDGCGSRQAMDEPDDKRAQGVVKAEGAEAPVDPVGQRLCGLVGMGF